MKPLVSAFRKLLNLKLTILQLGVVQDIPTETFNTIISTLLESGWAKAYEYENFDAWIDYGRIDLKRGGSTLRFEWDNWTEGQVIGPRKELELIAHRYGLSVLKRFKWPPNE